MSMQVVPNWSELMTPEQAEKELKDFKWRGVGFYLTKTDTLLVVPIKFANEGDNLFAFHVFNVSYEDTVFSQLNQFNIVLDERNK